VPGCDPVEWTVSGGLVPYPEAVRAMEARVAAIAAGDAAEQVWLLEHPPLYTAGTSARAGDLLDSQRFPVFKTGRGGQFTYHGPGQRIAYLMLDLNRRGRDLRRYVGAIEDWIIATLADFNVAGEQRADRIGVWVRRPDKPPLPDGSPAEDKIAAIGVRVRRWITFHGVSLNVDPDLDHYSGIVPCGIRGPGVTSLVDLGLPVAMEDVDAALRRAFELRFGATRTCAPATPAAAPPSPARP
jgi:lipoyl(octanoyl) transferase